MSSQGPHQQGLASLAGLQGLDIAAHLPHADLLAYSLNPLQPGTQLPLEQLMACANVARDVQHLLQATTMSHMWVHAVLL